MTTTQTTDDRPVAGVWVGRKLSRQVPLQLETQLADAQLFPKLDSASTEAHWSDSSAKGVLFDLSSVEWVEVGAVVQIVLLVERALRDQIPVTVAMPLQSARADEAQWVAGATAADRVDRKRLIDTKVANRRKARRFLNYLRFFPALRPQHLASRWQHLAVWDDFDASRYDPEAPILASRDLKLVDLSAWQEQASGREDTYQFDAPLSWLSTSDTELKVGLATLLSRIVGERHRGLQDHLAKAIANVLLYELVDNVGSHAGGPTHALVAAAARGDAFIGNRDPDRYRDDYLGYESDYLDWLIGDAKPLIEIVLGDSGLGIPTRLGEKFDRSAASRPFGANRNANILAWAFDRWSSSDDSQSKRGTRGLYRVDRIVKRAQGLIALRCTNEAVAWDHGGPHHDALVRASEPLPMLPGTILRLRMPAFQRPVFVGRADSTLMQAPVPAPQEVSLGTLTDSGLDPLA